MQGTDDVPTRHYAKMKAERRRLELLDFLSATLIPDAPLPADRPGHHDTTNLLERQRALRAILNLGIETRPYDVESTEALERLVELTLLPSQFRANAQDAKRGRKDLDQRRDNGVRRTRGVRRVSRRSFCMPGE